jgi:hypothetical protein
MASTISTPSFTFGQTVYTIGDTQILTGDITGMNYIEPTDGTNIGNIAYTITYNRETSGETKDTHSGSTIYSTHDLALAAFGARG